MAIKLPSKNVVGSREVPQCKVMVSEGTVTSY